MDIDYTRRGQGNLNTVLGAIGTAGAVGLLNGNGGGWMNGILGNGNCSAENMPINRYEAGMQQRIAALETEVKLRDANTYTLGEVGKLRDYLERRLDHVEHELCDQKTYNAVNTAAISCIQGQVAQLMGLTKLVIPNGSICPGWGNVTVAPATAASAG